jgi:transcriptional regulator with XRE-family HTH domain
LSGRNCGSFFHSLKRTANREHKLPQKELAEPLGVTVRACRYYEEGKRYPDFQGLPALADDFQIPLDYLVGRSDQR